MGKKCKKCGLVKDVSDFYKNKYSKDRLAYECKSCWLSETKKYRDKNPDKIKWTNRVQYLNKRDERLAKQKEYSNNNKEKILVYKKEWKARNPHYSRIATLKKRGITSAFFYEMWREQGMSCWICYKKFKNEADTHIDHDHQTGVVRGLLCGHCNTAIGLVREDPKVLNNMVYYLQNNKDGWKAF